MPERHLPGLARRGGDDDSVARDLLDAPRRCAEDEGLADARLVHHLLVELAHTAALGREHAVETAVGDGAAAGDGQHPGAGPGSQGVVGAIPHDARPQLGELVGGIAAGEHVEHALEHGPAAIGERVRAAGHFGHVVDGDVLDGAHGHDLLGQHVDGVARDARLLDEAFLHALGDDGGLDQVAPELREDAAP